MSGELRVEQLSDGTTTIDMSNFLGALPTAQFFYDEENDNVYESLNISSLTTATTGDWLIRFTNIFAYDDYFVAGTASYNDATDNTDTPSSGCNGYHPGSTAAQASICYYCVAITGSTTGWASESNSVGMIGDLA